MSSLLWHIRREREEQRKDDVRDRRVRRNLQGGGNGWVNSHPVPRQFEDREVDDEDCMDDEVYGAS